MAGMKFEYDESGTTFYYFLLAFYALVLLPLTYYFWPSSKSDKSELGKRKCHCDGCQNKQSILKSQSPWKETQKKFIKLLFFILWIVFAILLYKVNTIKMEWKDFDPFAVLKIDRDSNASEIRKAYRQLSLLHHPDKGGDPVAFQQISKAYRALTNEQDRKNWKTYGTPDGPGPVAFGIALPKWLVKRENRFLVLGAYGFVFMVLLPVAVGTWWYRTIKFTSKSILLMTTRIFAYFIVRTPSMSYRRIIMILASAREFCREDNQQIVERPSDNEEVPIVMRELSQVNEKNKEPPFCMAYALKARVLLHAHLNRLELNRNTLELDRRLVIRKCPELLHGMVNICNDICNDLLRDPMPRDPHMRPPRLETVECIMRLCPMLVQGLWETKSPLLQLPHITEESLRHFVTRKRNIRNVRQLVQMPDQERRALLRGLTDDQYKDVMTVAYGMPLVDMQFKVEVIDNKPDHVTAGSIVTVTVTLTRRSLEDVADSNSGADSSEVVPDEPSLQSAGGVGADEVDGGIQGGDGSPCKTQPQAGGGGGGASRSSAAVKRQAKRRKGKDASWMGKKGKQKQRQQQQQQKSNGQLVEASRVANNNEEQQQQQQQQQQQEDDEDEEEEAAAVAVANVNNRDEEEEDEEEAAAAAAAQDESGGGSESEDDGWNRLQEEVRRETKLETKEQSRWLVHCPLMPAEKREFWWLYICDKKRSTFVTLPQLVTSLNDYEEIPIRFMAPLKPCQLNYTLTLRSDSYLDVEINQPLKLEVLPASELPPPPVVYDSSDDDEEANSGESDDTDYDSSD